MGKQFVIIEPYNRVFMPNALVYDAGDTVVLSDANYDRLNEGQLRTFDPDDVTDVADPTVPGSPSGLELVYTTGDFSNIEVVMFAFDDGEATFAAEALTLNNGTVIDTAGVLTVAEAGLYRVQPRFAAAAAGAADLSITLKFGAEAVLVTIPTGLDYIGAPGANGVASTTVAIEPGAEITLLPTGTFSDWTGLQVGCFLFKIMGGA